jgi:hypothetical protein
LTKDDSIKVTAPPSSHFTKITLKAKPAPARTKAVLSQLDSSTPEFFSSQAKYNWLEVIKEKSPSDIID